MNASAGNVYAYTSGSDILGVDASSDKYLGVFELNSSGAVVKFKSFTLTSASLKGATTAVVTTNGVEATQNSHTITVTLSSGTFDPTNGAIAANWSITGTNASDLGTISSVSISSDGRTATLTVSGTVGAPSSVYKVAPNSTTAMTNGYGLFTATTVHVQPGQSAITLSATTGDKSVTLNFTTPGTGSTTVLKEQVGSSTTWTTVPVTISPTSTSAAVSSLTDGTSYSFELIITGGSKAGVTNVVTVTPAAQSGTVTFADSALEAAVRAAINNPSGPILRSQVAAITTLTASSKGIISLEGIEALTNLKTLDLSYNNSISDITPLYGLTNLTSLDLSTNNISDIGTSNFKNLTKLTYLDLGVNNFSSIDPVIAGLTNLTYLDISFNNIQNVQTNEFKELTNLQTLKMNGDIYGDFRLAIQDGAFNGLGNLTELDCTNSSVTSIDRNTFQGLINLKNLSMGGNRISTLGANTFADMPNLTSLSMYGGSDPTYGSMITEIDSDAFNGLSNLQTLSLDQNDLTTLGVNAFAGLTSLNFLNLSNSNIPTSVSASTFACLINLATLDITYNHQLNNIYKRNEGL